jgi:hypothetical protein
MVLFATCPLKAHTISFQAKSPDFDGSGLVDFSDFLLFAGAFGSSSSNEDLDSSGSVDFPDFLIFAAAFGTSPGAGGGDNTGTEEVLVSAVSGQTTDAESMAASFAPYSRISTRFDDDYIVCRFVWDSGSPDDGEYHGLDRTGADPSAVYG